MRYLTFLGVLVFLVCMAAVCVRAIEPACLCLAVLCGLLIAENAS